MEKKLVRLNYHDTSKDGVYCEVRVEWALLFIFVVFMILIFIANL
jgi:hypothetical protein